MKRFPPQFAIAALVVWIPVAGYPGRSAADAVPQRQIAISLEQQGKNAEAEAAWRNVLQSNPHSAEAYAHLGFLKAHEERYTEATPLYRKALALNPAMPGLRLNLGLSLFKSGELNDTVQVLTPLLKTEPPSSPERQRLNILIGMSHYGLNEYAAAVPYLRAAAATDPKSLWLRLTLVHSCLGSKQFQCVLDVYKEILVLNAESAEADMLAGEALDEMRDDAGAIEQFRAAVKANPQEPNVHFGLGYLLWRQKHFEEAAEEFQAELGNVPDHPQALLYWGDAEMQLNHREKAQPLIEKVIQMSPGLERAHLDLGILYAEDGRAQEGLEELKQAVHLSPKDADAHWRLARLYQSLGKQEEARVEFQKTSSLHKSANETIFLKLEEAQRGGKPREAGAGGGIEEK